MYYVNVYIATTIVVIKVIIRVINKVICYIKVIENTKYMFKNLVRARTCEGLVISDDLEINIFFY